MCYLNRHAQFEAELGGTMPSPSLQPPPKRWIAAAAATLIGGLAVAALVVPPSSGPLVGAKDPSAALAPVASRTAAVPATGVVQQRALPLDDGVPTSSDVAKAGLGHCEHGL